MANQTLTFEIGTEELPAFALHAATEKLGGMFADALDGAGIPHGEISVYSTPRRLIVSALAVPEATEALTETFRGPAAKIAFDADGNPTKAALGFARGKGVDASALERRDENGVEYVYAVKSTPSVQVITLLPDILQNLITSIYWPRSQRWGSRHEHFSRPVRWLFAMHGDAVVPVEFAGLTAGNTTCGHRFLAPGPWEVSSADALIDVLREHNVVPTEAEREASIREQVAAIEEKTGLVAELPAKTMAEVVNLAEFPTVMVGEFDELFLAVPKEITVDAMLVHQRYFPLFNADGTLANKFLITSNGDPKFEANIVDGNQRVVAARLYDAKFFYDEDLKRPLEDYVERLDTVVFQEKLGTTRAKTDRIVALAKAIAADAGVTGQEAADAERAAYLAKADLVTGAVVEFTSVQGIMGSSDPFALRRSALGIVTMLLSDKGLDISLGAAVDVALASYAAQGIEFDAAAVRADVVDFFITRTKVMAKDEGAAPDAIDAVLAVSVEEPVVFMQRVRALVAARDQQAETFDDLATAYARANNLRDEKLGTNVDESLLGDEERALLDAVTAAEGKVAEHLAGNEYAAALAELANLRAPIDAFFDGVMVMDENEAIRENRLRLLNRFVAVFKDVADFGKMAKK